ncbi:Metallo-dependent phosphatase-like protein [Gilbertella persicaria]|uniref:Metallo-dependent phosphatase-like protein n=1 Tax=Gilbertella persicaria TaxID=101096 RepID=UPI002220A03F|nr:Metallo-dependent phosphatase-like protein [Gilbertella persicaria]KAI8098257.1 Metallo-dependent phosphatase-like protein [Gilbertella persicaria]
MKILSLYWASLLLSCTVSAAATNNQQAFFGVAPVNTVHGRFLHITDIHMDKHYITGATIKSDCHREPKKHKHRKKKEGLLAGYWGAPGTNCDSPARLVYYSIDYIAKEWKDKIDFVIWTGDNARHDGDAYITRTKKEIVGYNQKVTDALKKAFTTKHNRTLPIVPCIGNNDIHPHNELRGMKNNPQLLEFSAMWSDFIPSDQQKHFKKGGYFAVDVAPGMRVLSLNSLYFFGSNDVVNSCSDKSSPGARHVHWLRKQLKHARRDGVKVIMMGHVPPTVKSFKDSCLDDYIKLSTKFADIITGHMYGHANFDHFQIISKALDNSASAFLSNGDIHALQDTGRFVSSLHKQYKQVKKVRDHKSLVVVNVAPPMLPLFYPTFRINEYNANLSSPQFGDWLKYTQWYTNLTYWNEQRNKFGKHALPTFEIEYATDKDYHMSDLTRESWLKFAQRISSKKGRKLWKEYMANMFCA